MLGLYRQLDASLLRTLRINIRIRVVPAAQLSLKVATPSRRTLPEQSVLPERTRPGSWLAGLPP